MAKPKLDSRGQSIKHQEPPYIDVVHIATVGSITGSSIGLERVLVQQGLLVGRHPHGETQGQERGQQ